LQVFAGLYPADQSEFDALRDALEKLTLNDASVTMVKESRYRVLLCYDNIIFLIIMR